MYRMPHWGLLRQPYNICSLSRNKLISHSHQFLWETLYTATKIPLFSISFLHNTASNTQRCWPNQKWN